MPIPAADSGLAKAEWVLFGLAVVASPLRLRATILRRPFGTIYGDYTDFLLFASDGLVLLLLAIWGLRMAIERRRPRPAPRGFTRLLLAFTLIAGISAAASVDRGLSLYHCLRLLVLFGLFAWIAERRLQPGDLAWPAAAMVGLQAVVGLAQFLSGTDAGLQALGEYELDPAWPGVSIVAAGGERWLRAYGLSDHPNILGGLMAFGALLLMARTMRAKGFDAAILSVATVGGMAGLLATFSRSAWLGFAAGQAALAGGLMVRRRFTHVGRQAVLLAMGGLAALPLMGSHWGLFASRLGAEDVPQEIQSLGERALLAEAANEMFISRPILGVGLGASPLALESLRPDWPTYLQPPHNALLAAAAETGLFGAAAYALLLLTPWLLALPRLRASTDAGLVYGLLLAATVIGFFDYYTWLLTPGRFWQYLIWGLAAVQIGHPGEGADE